MLKKSYYLTFGVFFLLLSTVRGIEAQQTFDILIDDFKVTQQVRAQSPDQFQRSINIVPNFRKYRIFDIRSATNPPSNNVRGELKSSQAMFNNNGGHTHAEAAASAANSRAIWTDQENINPSDPTNLGDNPFLALNSVDVSRCASVTLTNFSFDAPGGANTAQAQAFIDLIFYDQSDPSGSKSSRARVELKRPYNRENLSVPLTTFNQHGLGGAANLSKVGAFEIGYKTNPDFLVLSKDIEVDDIKVTDCQFPPTPTPTATPEKECLAQIGTQVKVFCSFSGFYINRNNITTNRFQPLPPSTCLDTENHPVVNSLLGAPPSCLMSQLSACGVGTNTLINRQNFCASQCAAMSAYLPIANNNINLPNYFSSTGSGVFAPPTATGQNFSDALYTLSRSCPMKGYLGKTSDRMILTTAMLLGSTSASSYRLLDLHNPFGTLYYKQDSSSVCSFVDYTKLPASEQARYQICSKTMVTTAANNIILTPIVLEWSPGEAEKINTSLFSDFKLDPEAREKRYYKWPAGSEIGFLGWDRNDDGIINDGSELFGNALKLGEDWGERRFANGYEALALFDSNSDGKITTDEFPAKLVVGFDRNKDGRFEPKEVISAKKSGLKVLYYNPDIIEPTFGTLLTSGIGFERVENGKKIDGRTADFFTPRLLRNPDEKIDDPKSLQELAGFWKWTSSILVEDQNGQPKESPAHGVLVFDLIGRNIVGNSMVELPIIGNGFIDANKMVLNYPIFDGEIVEIKPNGALKIAFKVGDNNGNLSETVGELSEDRKEIRAVTSVINPEGQKFMEYAWRAEKA
ncbi:MAG TPA: hypothetical protein PKD37_04380 [Oligoflexia bacterium]|nr:hypothetical protein [Oligoflexia bacterium]HMP27203.1 hypothetical protein [Oligoflexia bacterium]